MLKHDRNPTSGICVHTEHIQSLNKSLIILQLLYSQQVSDTQSFKMSTIFILVLVLTVALCFYWYLKNRALYQLNIAELDVYFKQFYPIIKLGLMGSEGL